MGHSCRNGKEDEVMAKSSGFKLIANNKKAYFDFFIDDKFECGIALAGTEVKSLRMGKCSIKESFVRITNDEVMIYGMHISPYEKGNIFNKDRFEKMKNTSILLNAGRGSAVNTEDLCEALIQGQIYGAGLDVTDPEPLQTQHKLWNVENVIITPHVAGDFHHPATLYRIVDIIAGNLQRYLEGEQLMNIVDTTTGCKL